MYAVAPSPIATAALWEASRLCAELWNLTLTQRRNKYSWGKTSLETQQQELEELRADCPEFRLAPLSVLVYVFEALEQAYQEFMPRRRQKGVQPPQFCSLADFFPLRYARPDFALAGPTLGLKHGEGWIELELPAGEYPEPAAVVIHWDGQAWGVELL